MTGWPLSSCLAMAQVTWAYCGRVRVSIRVKVRPKSCGQASDCGGRKYNSFIERVTREDIYKDEE